MILLTHLKKHYRVLVIILFIIISVSYFQIDSTQIVLEEQTVKVKRESFEVNVQTIGELEATHSITIAFAGKGDNCKIIYLIPDGINVDKDDVLVKIDPTFFEEKFESLKNRLKDQEGHANALKKGLEWEMSQADKDDKMAIFEIEAAELELSKILYGDGPLETSRLKGAMQKALAKYNEYSGYSDDLQELLKEGFLNPAEVKNAQKKLEEEKEAYEAAKLQFESFYNHVYPMQVKKAEAALKQSKIRREESNKVHGHSIGKAMVELDQAVQALESIKMQFRDVEREIALTEIRAPTPGMVVQRDEFRNGQRRKPRIGDIAVRNQPLLDLPDLNSMTVRSKVREVDLCKIDIGKKATVEIDAYPQLHFTGIITSIGVLALSDHSKPSEEKYFEIRILLDQSDPKVRPGMTTRITIHSDAIQDALTVPVHTLFYQDNQPYCFLATPSGYVKRQIVKGICNEDVAEIKEGLSEGESVCLSMPKEFL